MIGKSQHSFEEHLMPINRLNSYQEVDLVLPVYYQSKNEVAK
jgi:hypothetical protein